MLHSTRTTRRKIALFLAAALVSMLLRPIPDRFPFIQISAIAYSALILCWGASVQRRILNASVRRCLLGIAGLMLFLMLMRTNKYSLLEELPGLQMYALYGYSVSYSGMAMLSLCAARGIGEEDGRAARRCFLRLLPLWVAVVGVTLTNEAHRLVYRFAPGEPDRIHHYANGPLYWLSAVLFVSLLLAALLIVLHKSRRTLPRRLMLVPTGVLVVFGCFYLLYFINGNVVPDIVLPHLLNPPEALCFALGAFWESCIQIGLVPSCSGYETIFRISSVGAVIADGKGKPVLAASGSADAPDGAHVVWREHAISGGSIRWREDLSTLDALNERLDQSIERLSDENALISAEIALREKRGRIETQNRLYDEISRAVEPQTARIEAWTRADGDGADYRRGLARCCVLGAFVKRRANFTMLCAERERLSPDELYYAVRESLESLRRCGVQTALFYAAPKGEAKAHELPGEAVVSAYECFESVAETAMDGAAALIVHVMADGPFLLRMELQGAPARPLQAAEGMVLRCVDGAVFATVPAPAEGGERA